MFKGSMVALVTPMQIDGSIDKKSLYELVEWHISSHTDALVIAGTTGESATLSPDEKVDLITTVVKQVAGRIPVIAGTGSNCTRTTIRYTQAAYQAGVDGCLIVTPYYNKPTQNGLFEHYRTVAALVPLPVILYNVPGRTACDLLPETVERLAKLTNITGIKEATGNLQRGKEILERCGKNFGLYSGDDATGADLMLNGAHGVISVTANVAPKKMYELCVAALSGNKELTDQLNTELMPLHTKLFLESNPIPTKWALREMGMIDEGIRLPLTPLDAKHHEDLRVALHQTGTLSTTKA
jgi:4-hydroxy-tetrahydrodipicolinate synthase